MAEMELIERFISLGLGAVIAWILLQWKRQDDKDREKVLEGLLQRQFSQNDQTLQAIREMIVALKGVQESLDAIAQMQRIEDLIQQTQAPSPSPGRPRPRDRD